MSRCGGFLAATCLLLLALLAVAPHTAGSASSFSWETREALGDAAVALEIDGPAGASCNAQIEMAGWMEDHGVVERIYLWEWADGESDWFHGSDGDELHAFVAPVVDTRGGPPGFQGLWASTTSIPLPVRGGVTLTVAAPGLEPWPDGFDNGEVSMRIDLVCSQNVTVSLSGGREVQILTTRNAVTGAGVWWSDEEDDGSPIVDAGVGNLVMGDYSSQDVRMRAGAEGVQAGALTLVGPGIVKPWALYPGDKQTLAEDGGPGTYLMALNRAGGLDEDFWSVLMGLHPVSDLDEIAGLPSL